MPVNPQYVNPANLNPSLAVGVNIPFNSGAVFSSTYTTQEAIKNNLINFFLTEPGELPLNPTFGGGLRSFLFEQIELGNINNLKGNVSSKLATYFPTVNVVSLDVLSDPYTPNALTVNLKYSVNNTPGSVTFQF
jgi:phage baseplate assembly protein W